MGIGKHVMNWLCHRPKSARRNAWLAALATLPYACYRQWAYMEETHDVSIPSMAKFGGLPLLAWLAAYLGTAVLHAFTREKHATRPADYAIIKGLEEKLDQQSPPTIPFTGEHKLNYSISDVFRYHYKDVATVDTRARETRNPLAALDATIRYFGSANNMDEGLILLRDALDWLEGKKPVLDWKTKLLFLRQTLAIKAARKLEPSAPEAYIFSAAYESIMHPERAWYWSELGRQVADTFAHPEQKEMYVFHALLATAQQRSDQNEAWADAFRVLQRNCVPERLGESQNPFWVLRDEKKKFFAETIALKGNKDPADRDIECKCNSDLSMLLAGRAKTPSMLYRFPEPIDGYHVFAMRYAQGKTLHERLEAKELGTLEKITPLLARILARYPAGHLPLISLDEKIEKKLYAPELGIPHDLANAILSHMRPVHKGILEHGVLAVNKDAHPEQWLIDDKGQVTVLDNLLKNRQPATLDSANLYNYADYLNPQQLKESVLAFRKALQEEGSSLSMPELRNAYGEDKILFRAHHNSVIHRQLCFVTAWSGSERPTMRAKRAGAIQQAITSIDRLKNDDSAYYNNHKEDYDELRPALEKMRELIAP